MSGLHKHEPVPESAMKWISDKYSICEILREIYNQTEKQDIRYKCRVAVSMAKAMSKRLKELSPNWKEDFFDKNNKYIEHLKKIYKIEDI
jgi:ABC-type Zn uptake system ZnuABC Zn-binding protein ZnuA